MCFEVITVCHSPRHSLIGSPPHTFTHVFTHPPLYSGTLLGGVREGGGRGCLGETGVKCGGKGVPGCSSGGGCGVLPSQTTYEVQDNFRWLRAGLPAGAHPYTCCSGQAEEKNCRGKLSGGATSRSRSKLKLLKVLIVLSVHCSASASSPEQSSRPGRMARGCWGRCLDRSIVVSKLKIVAYLFIVTFLHLISGFQRQSCVASILLRCSKFYQNFQSIL